MSTNTHFYDGKLIHAFKEHDAGEADIEGFVSSLRCEDAKRMVRLMLSDRKGNRDTRNHVDALDILRFLIVKGFPEDTLRIVEEQLADTYRLGRCAQGRTTRLIQVYNIIKEL